METIQILVFLPVTVMARYIVQWFANLFSVIPFYAILSRLRVGSSPPAFSVIIKNCYEAVGNGFTKEDSVPYPGVT